MNELYNSVNKLIKYLKFKSLNDEEFILLTQNNRENLNLLFKTNKKLKKTLNNIKLHNNDIVNKLQVESPIILKKEDKNISKTTEVINNQIVKDINITNYNKKEDFSNLCFSSLKPLIIEDHEKELDYSNKDKSFMKLLNIFINDSDANNKNHFKNKIIFSNLFKYKKNDLSADNSEKYIISDKSKKIINSDLMIIGDSPSYSDEIGCNPFLGDPGEKLDKILSAMGLYRNEIYLTNLVKSRPRISESENQIDQDRKPNHKEFFLHLPYLLTEINILKPKVILCMGSLAAKIVLNKININHPVSKFRNKKHIIPYNGINKNIPVYVTYHPSYISRNDINSEKRKVWEDMLKIMRILNLPISIKQKNYFKSKLA